MSKKNSKRQQHNKTITTRIIAEFKDHNRAQIRKWRNALALAQSIDNPRLYLLQDLYDNLSSDGHLQAQIHIRKSATSSCGFSIIDRTTGKVDEHWTDFFSNEWFFEFMDMALDSIFRGFTLLELTNSHNLQFSLIPYRNLVPTQHRVLLNTHGESFIDYSLDYQYTLIHIGKPDSLGLLSDLCPQLIWKRNAQQSWAEFAEKFGMPLLTAKTTSTDPSEIAHIRNMLNALGEAARAVLPEGSSLEVTQFSSADAYQVYDRQIERINGEIAKPITGGTMITDDGSSRSQSEVHKDNLDYKLAEKDRRMIQFLVNGQLIPMLYYWDYDINPQRYKFQFDYTFELSLTEHWNIVNQMLNRFQIPTDWLAETFNVPIIKERENPINSLAQPLPAQASLSDSFR